MTNNLTIKQLKYLIEIDNCRNFNEASVNLDVVPSTLSDSITKLEKELGAKIFHKFSNGAKTTEIGEKIIEHARLVLATIDQFEDIVRTKNIKIEGDLNIAISPSVSNYLSGALYGIFRNQYPKVNLNIEEMMTKKMLEALKKGTVDIAIDISDIKTDSTIREEMTRDILEIPLYRDQYGIYVNKNYDFHSNIDMDYGSMVTMKDAYNSTDKIKGNIEHKSQYSIGNGNYQTLVGAVDQTGGYAIIPKMQKKFLSEEQKPNMQDNDGKHSEYLYTSIYVKKTFTRESILNAVVDAIKEIIPIEMFAPERQGGDKIKLFP